MNKKVVEHLSLFSLYAFLTLCVTFPLVFHLSTHFPSDYFDSSKYIWNMWWMKETLLSGHNPFYSHSIYYPFDTGLTYDAFTPLRAFISVPLQLLIGLIPAHNLLILVSLSLTGYFTYLLSYELTQNKKASFLAGLFFMLSPFVTAKIEIHINLSELQYIPLFILLLVRLKKHVLFKYALFTTATLTAIFLTDYYQFFLAIIFLLLCIIFYAKGLNEKKYFALCLGLTFIVIFPWLFQFFDDRTTYDYAEIFLTDLNSRSFIQYLTPPQQVWYQRLLNPQNIKNLGKNFEPAFLGFIPMLVVLSQLKYLLKHRPTKFLFLVLSVCLIFTLGANVTIPLENPLSLPLPFSILLKIPVLKNLRAPSRFTILMLPMFSTLLAFSYDNITKNLTQTGKNIAFIAGIIILVAEFASIPVSLESYSFPEFFSSVARDPEKYAILSFPLETWSDEARAALAQTVHRKPIFGGIVSRPPNKVVNYYYALPVIKELLHYQFDGVYPDLTPTEIDEERTRANKYFLENHVKYVVIYKKDYTLSTIHYGRLLELFRLFFTDKQITFEDNRITVFKMY